jgi:acyl-coenzyme A thioesterase PaaI-like protein
MSSSQQDVTRGVLDAVHDFLGGPTPEGDGWRFTFGEHLNSNWGAVFGGALAAGMLAVGRLVVPERSPRSMHVQIVRSVPSGIARAAAIVRHLGRTVATVEVDLFDQRDKLASIASLTMVSPEALAADYDHAVAAPAFRLRDAAQPVADPIPGGINAPIIVALNLSPATVLADNVRRGVDGSSAPVMECTIPWDALEHTGPEAACLIADAATARAVSSSYISSSAIGPNPDLTLRFSTAPATRVIVAASTLLSVQRGSTTVGIEVQAGDNQLAHALATSLLLDRS